jgi:hypothetical protein
MKVHELLYSTIKSFELQERIRREDFTFDAFNYLAREIGHKNSSTLRKMCEPRCTANQAKLGFQEATIIMSITHDYRLLTFMKKQLKAAAEDNPMQIDMFSLPQRTIEEN